MADEPTCSDTGVSAATERRAHELLEDVEVVAVSLALLTIWLSSDTESPRDANWERLLASRIAKMKKGVHFRVARRVTELLRTALDQLGDTDPGRELRELAIRLASEFTKRRLARFGENVAS